MAGGSEHDTESLAEPLDDEEIYGARGEDVLPSRPIMQGDVFAGVSIRGYEEPRLTAAAVIDYQYLPPRNWPKGHYGIFPLPALGEADGNPRHAAVSFEEIFTVEAAELEPSRRLSFLSSRGVYLFQQRFLCSLSRVVVPLARVREACEHVLEEARCMAMHHGHRRTATALAARLDLLAAVAHHHAERIQNSRWGSPVSPQITQRSSRPYRRSRPRGSIAGGLWFLRHRLSSAPPRH